MVLLFSAAACSEKSTASDQSGSDSAVSQETPSKAVVRVAEAQPPTATAVPTATQTPTPTITPTPEPTPTPLPDDCTVARHDVTKLHGIHNAEQQCDYDHSHSNSASIAARSALFDALVGQGISYPWCTGPQDDGPCSENGMYPDGKHEAYNFDTGHTDQDWTCPRSAESCSLGYEAEWHGMSNNMGMRTRFHSFFTILYPEVAPGGYIAWGGWMDCGNSVTIDDAIQIDTDDSRPQPDDTAIRHSQWWNNSQTWYCQLPDLFIENNFGQHYGDDSGRVSAENLFEPLDTFCKAGDGADCMQRGQRVEVELLLFDLTPLSVRAIVDPDDNGFVEHFEAWTDRWGNVQPDGTCVESALDCVPLVIHSVPILRYQAQDNVFERLNVDSVEQVPLLDWFNRPNAHSSNTDVNTVAHE
jgi:hypothetical protein